MRRPLQCGARRYEPDASSGPQRIHGAGVYNLPVKLSRIILPPSSLVLSSGSASHVVCVRMTSFVVRSCDDRSCIACASMSESARVTPSTFAIIRLAAGRIRIRRRKAGGRIGRALDGPGHSADGLLPDAGAKVPCCGRDRPAGDGLRCLGRGCRPRPRHTCVGAPTDDFVYICGLTVPAHGPQDTSVGGAHTAHQEQGMLYYMQEGPGWRRSRCRVQLVRNGTHTRSCPWVKTP